MNATIEMIVVVVVVLVALIWAGRAGWRSVRNQGVCSSCGSSGDCPVAGNPEALSELSKRGQLNQLDSCQPGTFSCQDLAGSLEKEPSAKNDDPLDR